MCLRTKRKAPSVGTDGACFNFFAARPRWLRHRRFDDFTAARAEAAAHDDGGGRQTALSRRERARVRANAGWKSRGPNHRVRPKLQRREASRSADLQTLGYLLQALNNLGTNAARALPELHRMLRAETNAARRDTIANSVHYISGSVQ